ncbi:MAG: class I SAM-dependent DNA methyltransferase [Polyangiaceae bacterium]
MSKRLSQQQLESYLWGAATILRGLVDAGDYKQFIFPLVFYKRLSDVWDEDFARALDAYDGDEELAKTEADERVVVPAGAHWNEARSVAKNVGRALHNAMRAIEAANPDRLDGIFGDAPWTNKDRLPDHTLKNLLEHFSSQTLSIERVPEDSLGDGYEYLVGKFADDGGSTAQEFYTNRTLVHLMATMLRPQEGESIYDPTCGTGGMLISALAQVKRAGGEHRTLRLYGQERNHMTASIARMNLVLHGVEDFDIQRGDTLERPRFIEGDGLRTFDVVLANPPYSIKRWNRDAWQSDPWGRSFLGTPPQGRADYAFLQHILKSMSPSSGRCAILFPHGVLFRREEAEMRRKLVAADLIECVLGLGPNLFFNSPMEACVLFCRSRKPAARAGRIIFIDAVTEIAQERGASFLQPKHQRRIAEAYAAFESRDGFARVVAIPEVEKNGCNLSLPLYVERDQSAGAGSEERELRNLSTSLRQQT